MANVQVANTDAQLTGKQLSTTGEIIAEGTIANAAIITLPTTPISLVATPGVNKRILFLWADLVADCAGGAYTNIDTSDSALFINTQNNEQAGSVIMRNHTSAPAMTDISTFLGTASKQQVMFVPGIYAPDTGAALGCAPIPLTITGGSYNVPLLLQMDNNGAGNFTGGNGSNTIKYKLAYVIQTF